MWKQIARSGDAGGYDDKVNATISNGGLQDIPVHLYEAAQMDGAGALRTFFQLIVPLAKPCAVE